MSLAPIVHTAPDSDHALRITAPVISPAQAIRAILFFAAMALIAGTLVASTNGDARPLSGTAPSLPGAGHAAPSRLGN